MAPSEQEKTKGKARYEPYAGDVQHLPTTITKLTAYIVWKLQDQLLLAWLQPSFSKLFVANIYGKLGKRFTTIFLPRQNSKLVNNACSFIIPKKEIGLLLNSSCGSKL